LPVEAEMGTSRSVVEAIDRLGDHGSAIGCGPWYPQFRTGPYEEVLVSNSKVTITLKKDASGQQYFSSVGNLTNLCGDDLNGSAVKTALPTLITPDTAKYLLTFPPEQPAPFDALPVNTGTGPLAPGEIPPGSYTKQFYDFGDGSTLVTEGPAFPKLTYLDDGGSAQFWVGFVGAITQGTGRFAGARGMASFNGSAYFKPFPPPPQFPAIVAILEKGFPANVAVCIKVITGDHLAGGS
jgi:hypothetical protein